LRKKHGVQFADRGDEVPPLEGVKSEGGQTGTLLVIEASWRDETRALVLHWREFILEELVKDGDDSCEDTRNCADANPKQPGCVLHRCIRVEDEKRHS
jgi:hypothetical protein